jgi:hypothetical protein
MQHARHLCCKRTHSVRGRILARECLFVRQQRAAACGVLVTCVARERPLVRHRILATHSSKTEAGSKLVAILLPTPFIKRKHSSGEHILVREHILER